MAAAPGPPDAPNLPEPPDAPPPPGLPLAEGEPVLLIDGKGRKYLLHLRADGVFQYHLGALAHAELIGAPDGARLQSSKGAPLTALRPRLGDYLLKMRRGPQIVYPKDLGAVLMYADIHPGLTVVEATDYVPEARRRHYVEGRAMRRAQHPEDVQGAVTFLLSDAADFVTGQLLPVNGGFVMH